MMNLFFHVPQKPDPWSNQTKKNGYETLLASLIGDVKDTLAD